jgi:hypothetical protein
MAKRFQISRRQFVGVVAAAFGSLFGAGIGLRMLRGLAPTNSGLRLLDDGEYRTVALLAEALFPRGGAFAQGAHDFDLARRFDGFLADEPPWNQSDLRNAILLLEYSPLMLDHRLRTFSHLSIAERLALFERWRSADHLELRQAATAFHKFMSLVFYDRPAVWDAIHYDGPLIKTAD